MTDTKVWPKVTKTVYLYYNRLLSLIHWINFPWIMVLDHYTKKKHFDLYKNLSTYRLFYIL